MATAKDIMATEVVLIDGNETVAAAVAKMKEHRTRTLIVDRRDESDAYGIVTYRDVAYEVVATGADPNETKVHEVMSKPLVVVNPDLDVKYVARLFANIGLSRAPVIAEGKLAGIVSVSDIINKAM